jgi:hypothetical protein
MIVHIFNPTHHDDADDFGLSSTRLHRNKVLLIHQEGPGLLKAQPSGQARCGERIAS